MLSSQSQESLVGGVVCMSSYMMTRQWVFRKAAALRTQAILSVLTKNVRSAARVPWHWPDAHGDMAGEQGR